MKKRTLIDYDSGKISYEVTDVDVEYNKVTNNRKKVTFYKVKKKIIYTPKNIFKDDL